MFGADVAMMEALGLLLSQGQNMAGSLGEPVEFVSHHTRPFVYSLGLLDEPNACQQLKVKYNCLIAAIVCRKGFIRLEGFAFGYRNGFWGLFSPFAFHLDRFLFYTLACYFDFVLLRLKGFALSY